MMTSFMKARWFKGAIVIGVAEPIEIITIGFFVVLIVFLGVVREEITVVIVIIVI